jgi:hypothetical protein
MPLPDSGFDAVICFEAAGDICVRTADKPRLLAELRRMLRPGGQVGFSDLVFDRPPTAAEDRALRALLYHSARELLTDWPGLFAAAGFQLGTVRDIQAQTLPTGQHVQAVYRQHAAQIRVRYGQRLGPGIARLIARQVAQVAAAIRRCGSYPALSATAPSTPPASLPAVHPSDPPVALRRSACPPAAGLLPWPERARRRYRRDTGRCRGPAAVTARARPAEPASAEPQNPARQP